MNPMHEAQQSPWLYRLIAGLNLRFPTLFLLLAGLTLVDLVTPDPLPFVDELFMILLTLLVGSWKAHRTTRAARDSQQARPIKNVN